MSENVLGRLKGKAVPVIRTGNDETARRVVEWLREGGMSIFEITATVPGYAQLIKELANESSLLVGAGTILDDAAAKAAVDAGAQFIVSPCTVPDVIEAGRKAAVPVVAGAATPSEALEAHRHGAAAVKLFPARQLGGPGFVKALRSVFPNIAFIPTGGIEIDEISSYLAAGAHAVGLGSQIASETEIAAGERDKIVMRAAGLAQHG